MAFHVPQGRQGFFEDVVHRFRLLLRKGIISGIDPIRLNNWLANFVTAEDKYLAGHLLSGLTYRSDAMVKSSFQTDKLASVMSLSDELSTCLVLNTVAAARTLLRRHDAKLKPFGVTVQQFSLLAAIRFHPGAPVATLAQRVFLDRTSLTRNIDLLERKNLVRRVAGTVGNARLCELTAQGSAVLDRLLLDWQKAKSDLMMDISEQDAATYLRIAQQLSRE